MNTETLIKIREWEAERDRNLRIHCPLVAAKFQRWIDRAKKEGRKQEYKQQEGAIHENKLTVNDLSADVVERMKKMINEDRQMLKLRERHASFLRSHRYMEAMKLKQMMDGIETRVINQYLSEYEGMSESMDKFMREMSEEDREEINVLTNSIIMLCDMVETFTMDCNEILKNIILITV